MKITKADMELFSKLLEVEVRNIDKEIALFRHGKQNLNFENIQSAICSMVLRMSEFWEPGSDSDDGEGGIKAKLKKPGPTKTPGRAKKIKVKVK